MFVSLLGLSICEYFGYWRYIYIGNLRVFTEFNIHKVEEYFI